jgi:hypothetical protein
MHLSKAQPQLGKEFLDPHWKRIAFYAVVSISIGVVFAFSQLGTCYGDEGFHLLAAQLVMSGKKPYLDFFYQHPPLYVYLTAGWMSVFGDTWRSAHALSALFTSGCIVTVASYLFDRWRGQPAGPGVAVTATLILSLSSLVLAFGTLGQPYSFCLFFSVASFRLTISSGRSRNRVLPVLAGLCAGAAAASSLLSLPIAPILFFWMIRHNQNGNRLSKTLAFLCGALLPFVPLLILFVKGPRQVWLDLFQYHVFYRDPDPNASNFLANLKTLAKLIVESPGPMLLLVTLGSLRSFKKTYMGDGEWRTEFRLCFWLMLSLAAYLTLPLPTFAQYYVLLMPFVIILASAGIHLISTASGLGRMRWLIMAVIILTGTNLQGVYSEIRATRGCWQSLEGTAVRINSVTPADGLVYGNEMFYFVSRHLPPPGLENSFATDNLPATLAPLSHAATPAQIDERLASGYFDSVIIGADDPRVERFNLLGIYPRNQKLQVLRATYYLLSKR